MPAQPPGGSPEARPPADSEPGPEPEPRREAEVEPPAEVEPEATSPSEPEPPASPPPPAPDLSRYPPPSQPPLSRNPPPAALQQYPPPSPDMLQGPPPQAAPPTQQYPPPVQQPVQPAQYAPQYPPQYPPPAPPQYPQPPYGGPPPPGYRPAPPPGATTANQRILGLVLVVPALLLWIFTLLIPTIRTVWRSTRHQDLFGRGTGHAGNYSATFNAGYWKAVDATLLWAVGPLVAVAVVAPALAFLAWRSGNGLRRTVLVLLALPIATFTPAGWAVAQILPGHHTVFDARHHNSSARLFFWTATFALACALATMLYLAALRRWAPGPWAPGRMGALIAVWVVLTLAAVAFTAQSFTTQYVFGVSAKQGPLQSFQYREAFVLFGLGPAEATATMTLIGLAVLGLAAGLVVVFSRMRIQVEPTVATPVTSTPAGPPALQKQDPPAQAGPAAVPPRRPDPAVLVVGSVLLAGVLVVTGWALWPWFSLAFQSGVSNHTVSASTRLKNTYLPPLIGTLIQVPAAFLAALGIGALRPLGRWSELLLVPFLPWLFVTVGPLSMTFFTDAGNGHDLNKFSTLIPRILLSVPALVLLTALCRGQAVRWRAARLAGQPSGATFWRGVVAPALPLVLLLAGVQFLFTAQDVSWPAVAAAAPKHLTGPMLLFQQAEQFSVSRRLPVAWALPGLVLVVSAIGLIALLVAYVDRLSIRTGPVETE
ncbi:MAG: hypothetical protein ACJ73S_29105 [Mycobacteriales bacterium]